eukprot:EG_transcript_12166
MSVTRSLLQWLVDNGVTGVGGEDSPIGIYEAENGERGLLAALPIAPGQLIAAVPLRLALTDYEAGPLDQLVYAGAPWSVRLAAELVVWMHRTPAGSPWAPYFACLPRAVPSPLGTFGWEAIKALQYPPVQSDLNELAWLLTDSKQQMTDAGLLQSEEERDTFEWAMGLVHSRTFATAAREGGVGVRMLVPLMDMVNHGGDVYEGIPSRGIIRSTDNAEWKLRPPAEEGAGWWMELRALRKIEEGEEVLFSYGERNNDDFLLHYGFVPPRNPHDDYVLFEDWDEAEKWLARYASLPDKVLQRGRDVIEVVFREPPAEARRFVTDKDRDRLRLYHNGRMDPRLRAAFRAAIGDPAAAEDALQGRCRELLSEAPTSLVSDLKWLHRAGLEAHGFDELLAHYTAIGDPLLSHGMEATEGEDATLAVVYRAYKKMVLADYLNTTGTAQTI